MDRSALDAAYAAAVRYLQGLPERPVGASADAAAMRAALAGPLPDQGEPAARVVEALARNADPGIVATGGPRFFGFVIGGSVPAALAADWLTSAWDQNAGLFVLSPAAAVVEETVLGWLRELFSLPEGTGMGFVTGGQMANTTCLAAARQAVLARSGWDVAAEGLNGAPRIVVLAGDEAHVTVHGALRLLGLGDASVAELKSDGQGRMLPDALRDALRSAEGAPVIVCAQAGNVNTGDLTSIRRAYLQSVIIKFQIPKTKPQGISKLQTPTRRSRPLVIGKLVLPWNLGFGAWDFSFRAQRLDRIDKSGAARRQQTRNQRRARKKDRRAAKQRRIMRRNFKELRRNQTSQGKRRRNSNHESDHDRTHALADDELEHVARLRAERHADADFAGALFNRISDCAVNSDARQQERDAGKNSE